MTTPYKFQVRDAKRIEDFGGRCLLASEMGTGKTFTSLLWAKKYLDQGPVVIVCPATIKVNWQRECRLHIGVRAEILEGRRPPPNGLKGNPSKWYILNYDIMGDPASPDSWVSALYRIKPQLVIGDEIHYCKSPDAQRTKAFRHLCRRSPHVICISGTPLTNRPAELFPSLNILRPDLFTSFWSFGVRYCLPGNAPILMGDLSEREIKDIKIGDTVIGWKQEDGKRRTLFPAKVLDLVRKKSPLQEVTLTTGNKVVCTPDHQWATGRPQSDAYAYSIAKTGRLGGRGRSSASRIMEVFRGTSPKYDESVDYMMGYVHGAFRGDGWCVLNKHTKYHPFKKKKIQLANKYSIGFGCKDKEIIDRLIKYLSCLLKTSVTYRQCPDGLYRLTKVKNRRTYRFLTKSTKPRDSDEWWAGFLGGIYDTEGSGRTISQYKEVNPITYKMIQKGLARFKFQTVSCPESVRIIGNRKEFIRFWNIANPSLRRKLTKLIMSKGGRFNYGGVGISNNPPFVTDIKKLPGIHDTYTLTTETGNYIAYGHGSKNCAPRRTPWGWDFRGASHLDELHESLNDTLMVRTLKKEVLTQLPTKTRTIIPLEIEGRREYTMALTQFIRWLRKQSNSRAKKAVKAERLVQLGYLRRLAGRLKIKNVVKWLHEFFEESDEKLILFAVHQAVIKEIQERFKKMSVVVDGSVTGAKRQKAIDAFNSDSRTRLLIGNIQAAGVGWSCKSTSQIAFAELPWVPGELTQAEDRIHGIGRGTGGASYTYLVADDTIEMDLIKILQNKQNVLDHTLDGKAGISRFDILSKLETALVKKVKVRT